MLSSSNFRKAAKLTAPIFFGYIAIGIPFGLMVAESGYEWWVALLMSLVIYSGTGEYIGITLFASGIAANGSFRTAIISILGIQLFVGLRHCFYGIPMLEKYRGTGFKKIFLIFLLTDETFSLLSTGKVPKDADKGDYYLTVSLLNYSYWNLGSLIGALSGQFIPAEYLSGVDFALTALFIVLMISQIQESKEIFPSLLGIITACGAVILSYMKLIQPQNTILTGLTAGIAVMLMMKSLGYGEKRLSPEVSQKTLSDKERDR